MYKQHPDWVYYRKHGTPDGSWNSDEQSVMSRNLKVPGCADFTVNQYKHLVSDYGIDLIYVDGGDGLESVDWKRHEVTHNYDWLDMWGRIRNEIQSVRPDAGMFMNAEPGLNSDITYMEFWPRWNPVIKKGWWAFAGWAKNNKMWATRQGTLASPLNWLCWDALWSKKPEEGKCNEPWYTNYMFGYGFIAGWPELADPYEDSNRIRSINSRWFYVEAAAEVKQTVSASDVTSAPLGGVRRLMN